MIGRPDAGNSQVPPPARPDVGLAGQLRAATDEELVAILAAADEADIAIHRPDRHPGSGTGVQVARPMPATVEIVLLGALGCRHGMLAGGAGGYLVRTPATSVLVDPGPAALGMLVQLADRFSWAEVDAIACTHFHPDHYTDVIPCLEGMTSHATGTGRKLLAANPTVAARFTAFSPYHAGGMADVVTLAHATTDGTGEPSVKIGDLTIHATPAVHTEEKGRNRSAIGLALDTPAGGIWYTSDTNLADGLLSAVNDLLPDITLVIAHADASNIRREPGRAGLCHLETRDVPTIAAALRPRHVVIQHYDAAYSAARYRIAQAVWLQRQLDRDGLPTQVLPAASGLHITLGRDGISGWRIHLGSAAAPAISDYLQSALGPCHRCSLLG